METPFRRKEAWYPGISAVYLDSFSLQDRTFPNRVVFLIGKHGFSQALPRSWEKMSDPLRDQRIPKSPGLRAAIFNGISSQPSRFPSGCMKLTFPGWIFPVTVTG